MDRLAAVRADDLLILKHPDSRRRRRHDALVCQEGDRVRERVIRIRVAYAAIVERLDQLELPSLWRVRRVLGQGSSVSDNVDGGPGIRPVTHSVRRRIDGSTRKYQAAMPTAPSSESKSLFILEIRRAVPATGHVLKGGQAVVAARVKRGGSRKEGGRNRK
jgi:hypothetical protein